MKPSSKQPASERYPISEMVDDWASIPEDIRKRNPEWEFIRVTRQYKVLKGDMREVTNLMKKEATKRGLTLL